MIIYFILEEEAILRKMEIGKIGCYKKIEICINNNF